MGNAILERVDENLRDPQAEIAARLVGRQATRIDDGADAVVQNAIEHCKDIRTKYAVRRAWLHGGLRFKSQAGAQLRSLSRRRPQTLPAMT